MEGSAKELEVNPQFLTAEASQFGDVGMVYDHGRENLEQNAVNFLRYDEGQQSGYIRHAHTDDDLGLEAVLAPNV